MQFLLGNHDTHIKMNCPRTAIVIYLKLKYPADLGNSETSQRTGKVKSTVMSSSWWTII